MIQNIRNIKIKMFTKTLFAFAFALCLFKPLTADAATLAKDYEYTYEKIFASEENGGWGCIFDAARYAAENPDVVAVIGNDPAVLYNHYLTSGCFEGRKGYALDGDLSTGIYTPDTSSTYDLRTLEFIDTHITDTMTQFQKFQIVWNYLLDENNRVDMNAGDGDANNAWLLLDCLRILGIEYEFTDRWGSNQIQVLLDGTTYNIYIAWAEK